MAVLATVVGGEDLEDIRADAKIAAEATAEAQAAETESNVAATELKAAEDIVTSTETAVASLETAATTVVGAPPTTSAPPPPSNGSKYMDTSSDGGRSWTSSNVGFLPAVVAAAVLFVFSF